MNINWFPGHMKKALDNMKKNLKLVDFIIEIRDARIPHSSTNPEFEKIFLNKNRLIILNKMDLACEKENEKWLECLKNSETEVMLFDSKKNTGFNRVQDLSKKLMSSELELRKSKGMKDETLRAMVVGIPNVGKSTFINGIGKRRSLKVGNMPGVTRSFQWLKTDYGLELLDTPGVLWGDLSNDNTGLKLSFTGAIKNEVLSVDTLALRLIENIIEMDVGLLVERYGVNESSDALELMEDIGRKRGFLLPGNEIDYTRVANTVLTEFRNGVLGRVTLEKAEDYCD